MITANALTSIGITTFYILIVMFNQVWTAIMTYHRWWQTNEIFNDKFKFLRNCSMVLILVQTGCGKLLITPVLCFALYTSSHFQIRYLMAYFFLTIIEGS